MSQWGMAEPTVTRRTIFSWAFFDFANSAFTTLVVTFIYSTYFAKEIAPSMEIGTQYWSMAISISVRNSHHSLPLCASLRAGYASACSLHRRQCDD